MLNESEDVPVLGMEPDVWYGVTVGFNDGKSNKGIMRLVDYSLVGRSDDFIMFERIEGAGTNTPKRLGVTYFSYLLKDIRLISFSVLEPQDEYLRTDVAPIARSVEVDKWLSSHIGTFNNGPDRSGD